jgi:integrase
MLRVLRMMDDKGITVALKKVKGWSSRVFKDCVVTGVIDYDPIANIDNTHFRKHVTKHYATVTSEDDIKELLLTLETYKERGTYPVATALSLAPYLMLRPSEVSKLTWKEIGFKNKMIRISAERMKMTREHLIPMSNQVLAKFKEIKSLKLNNEYVFPSPMKSHSHINAESLRSAIRSIGISGDKFTTHGFRSMASTRLNEMNFNRDWIEIQLSHKESDSVRGAYNNAEYIEQRRDMMQQWSDYLDNLKGQVG